MIILKTENVYFEHVIILTNNAPFQTENLIDHIGCKIHHFVLVTGGKYYIGSFEHWNIEETAELEIPFKVLYML